MARSKPYPFNGVMINEAPKHFTQPKIMALDDKGNKVALDRVQDIDKKHYFPIPKTAVIETVETTIEAPSIDQLRFAELKAQRAWLKSDLKEEYKELKAKLA